MCGEAAAVVLLKRLPDALRDGDRVLAVIRGTAANQDGHTVNISTPSASSQAALYRAALNTAGVDAGTITMVEAHGPGTPVGDPIEYASLSEVYGTAGPCALTSVKTNFGHAQSASGVLGLMKTVLALQGAAIPKNLHFTRLPDQLAAIDYESLCATGGHGLASEWRESAPGSGVLLRCVGHQRPRHPGTGPGSGTRQRRRHPTEDRIMAVPPVVHLGRGTAPHRLPPDRLGGRASGCHPGGPVLHPGPPARAPAGPHRRPSPSSRSRNSPEALREVAEGDTPYQAALGHDDRGPVWVFSGQGSQWAQMGTDLLAERTGVRRDRSPGWSR